MKTEVYINDEAHEYLINLVAQEYYSEAWEFIARLCQSFEHSLNSIAAEIVIENNKGKD